MTTITSKRQLIIENILIALSYWAVSQLNFILFKSVGLLPMPIWPAASIAILASFYRGIYVIPGIAIGAILANYYSLGSSFIFASCIAIMNTAGPQLVAYIIRKIVTLNTIFKNIATVVSCFTLAIIVAPLLTAAGGVASKYILGLIAANEIAPAFFKWALAHSLGTLFFAFPIFIYFMKSNTKPSDLTRPSSPKNGKELIVIELTLIFAAFFWIADSIFEALWFPEYADTFSDFLFPIYDMHEMFMRIFVTMTFIISGFSVYKVVQVLMRQQHETLSIARDLSMTLDSIGDGVISTDMNGVITRLNPIAEQITGWKISEAVGKKMSEVFTVINATTNLPETNPVESVISTRTIHTLKPNTILVSKTGKKYFIADSAAPILSSSNELRGAILVFRDISEELEFQEKLKQIQHMDAIGQLAGGIAHDFNNMLGGIIGFAELLSNKVKDDAEATMYVDMIIDTSEKAAGLTHKLLSFAKKGNRPTTTVNMHDIINNSVELLKRTIDKRVTITTNLFAGDYFIVGDPSQLQNIIINMGVNAANAMKNSGEISINTENIMLSNEYCIHNHSNITPGRFIKLTITDIGCGISPTNLQRIFEPFFTTRENGKGIGLGLAAVYGTVQQHLGDITVSSTLDQGTTFTILLPTIKKPQQEPITSEEQVSKGNGNILIVDDEYIMRVTAKAILEELGYTVTVSSDGKEAVDIFRESFDKFDLVIVDMVMPFMNGKDCFAELRKIKPDARVILSSGFSQEEDVTEMKENGLSGYIAKPYRRAELSKIVSDTLSR